MKNLIIFSLLSLLIHPSILAQDILPFPKKKSSSVAGVTMQASQYKVQSAERHLPTDAPNILIVLIDDVGYGLPDTYGGEVHTPNLSRVANRGVSYNRFHSTAMCSPTRAALLTGRNHTRVGNGQIAELANNWDGFSGEIPKSSATVAEVLKHYGYNTAAWGKWHNTPATETTRMGPFDAWPTGYGFEYFYGFLAGEASQYEPTMVRNTTFAEIPESLANGEPYHLTNDIAEDAIAWLRNQNAISPDKPFFMYWAPGACHGPHQVAKKWSDKYKGKFDDGWDNYRQRVFERQKEMNWIPENTELTERPATLASWESIPEDQKPFQRRLMEVFAGFAEHTDYNVGRILDEIENQGKFDNTIVVYVWGDNGSSAEGQNGTISELLAQNGIATQIDDHIAALEELGGLEALGTDKTDNMYHAGWSWAGSTPYKSMKLVAAHFGGTRQPLAISWPKQLNHDGIYREQFHHVIDVVPTIYEVLGITPPKVVNGINQDPIDGQSMLYTFNEPNAESAISTQFFDIMGSRGIYHDGLFASTFGPREPWSTGAPNLKEWNPLDDEWQLYDIENDWSQSTDISQEHPDQLKYLKDLFMVESTKNKNLPIGGGLWVPVLHPEFKPRPSLTEWEFIGEISRIPEFNAPSIGNTNNQVTMEFEMDKKANGVLYALGGFSGGLTCYLKNGYLHYEYNLFEVERTKQVSSEALKKGKHTLVVTSHFEWTANGLLGKVSIKDNEKEILNFEVPRCAPLTFTANDCLDLGSDLGSPVSYDYYDQKPFKFNGQIIKTHISYLQE
jgi:arylsulfatase